MFSKEDLISSYSQAQAIEDGVLHLISPEISKDYFKYPVILSVGLVTLIEKAIANKKYMADYRGIVHDILSMCQIAARRSSEQDVLRAKVIIRGTGPRATYDLLMVCGPGDNSEPTITIMLPEDY